MDPKGKDTFPSITTNVPRSRKASSAKVVAGSPRPVDANLERVGSAISLLGATEGEILVLSTIMKVLLFPA